jgi:hypothetical protein
MDNEIQRLLESADADRNHSSVSFAERMFSDLNKAQKAFAALKTIICDVAAWNKVALLNNFKLFNEDGDERESSIVAENIIVRMSLKGSGKYDWVKIIQINERETAFIITVKPTHDPTDKDADKAQTSHFFTSESINNFCLQMEAEKVSFYVIGLNEKQNISEADGTIEIIRNVATANIGSYFGIQKAEWTAFCTNFLDLYKND